MVAAVKPACAIMKHNNPRGAAYGSTWAEAFEKAFWCARIAAFGGVVVFTKTLDVETAKAMSPHYFEVVCAPDFEGGALDVQSVNGYPAIIVMGTGEVKMNSGSEVHGAMLVPNGPCAARCGSTWIHWWSPVASANRSICAWVTSTQSVTATSCPTQEATSE